MDRGLGILDVGHEGGRDPTRVGKDGGDIVEDAHEGDGGEGGGVHEARRGGEAEPAVDEDEDGGDVEESDREGDDGHREGEADPASPLHLRAPRCPPPPKNKEKRKERNRGGRPPGGTTGGEATASPETAQRVGEKGRKE